MEKQDAINLIDDHKNKLLNPVEMLEWTILRVILLNVSDEAWEAALDKAHGTLSR